ncbi:MAG: LruC domain-containing protein [Bacteroidota bacterium]
MNNSFQKLLFLFGLTLLVSACLEVPTSDVDPSENDLNFEQLPVPENFDYATSRTVAFTVESSDKLANVPLQLYNGNPELGGELIERGFTDASGIARFTFELPIHIDSLYLEADYIGIPDLYQINLKNNPNGSFIIGENPEGEIQVAQGLVVNNTAEDPSVLRLGSSSSPTFRYRGNYNSIGDPSYIKSKRFQFTNDILSVANRSLPNRSPVTTHHPGYFSESAETELKLTDSSTVTITFLHEGAGLKSAMGYYSYDLNNPPQSADDIDEHIIIFPNCSYNNSGGGLARGEQVDLGVFPGNTGIGFFMVPDGWDSSSRTVRQRTNYNRRMKYARYAFNNFAPVGSRRHLVLLNDPIRELFFIGMEDISRPNGDLDCNDAVFVVQASKYSAIDKSNLSGVEEEEIDADSDGIGDAYDEFPNDPDLAYTSHSPGENEVGTLMFEDQWPKLGDFDLNDMVIRYNYEYELNASRKVKNINATYTVAAQGGAFRNGFGIELDIAPSLVSSVTGYQLSENIVSLSSNGVESGQSKAVIIAFDNGKSLVGNPDEVFINTDPTLTGRDPVVVSIRIELTSPVDKEDLGTSPYNAFIFTDLRRGYEVHLPDHAPTDLVQSNLFGTEDDDSDIVLGTKYYKNSYNAMWALHVPQEISYPNERAHVFNCFTRLKDWIVSGGSGYEDWYSNPAYQEPDNLFNP